MIYFVSRYNRMFAPIFPDLILSLLTVSSVNLFLVWVFRDTGHSTTLLFVPLTPLVGRIVNRDLFGRADPLSTLPLCPLLYLFSSTATLSLAPYLFVFLVVCLTLLFESSVSLHSFFLYFIYSNFFRYVKTTS